MAVRIVIGTAGHIDHGKSSLVKALTGSDPDRLAEEKRRGISIDLGFAHVTLAGGEEVSFVDVPGHERFIRNMLAGAAGIEAVLLVIAADESVKPQTREHFDISRLLGIERGIVVVTKADAASKERLEKTMQEARALTRGSFLENAPILAVSNTTGAGLDRLRAELAELARAAHHAEASGFPRLPIDRSFALKGFGTVVTGTLWSGVLSVGETVRIHPSGKEARIRGLQRHGKAVETAAAGDRTAVNLAGVEHSEIRRGCMLTSLNELETSSTLDVSVAWLPAAAQPEKASELLFAFGTAEQSAVLRPLNERIARLQLSEPVLALPGDRFVLRRPSPAMTVAGGIVIDIAPPRRLNRARTVERLARLENASAAARAELAVDESANGLSVKQLVRRIGVSPIPQTPNLIVLNGQRIVSKRWMEQRRARLTEWLAGFHAKNPSAAGAPLAQARLGLDPALFAAITNGLSSVNLQGDTVSLAGHRPRVSSGEARALQALEEQFREAGFQPPLTADILADKNTRPVLDSLVKSGKLIRVSNDLIFHADAIAQLRQLLAAHKGRRFSVPDFKSWTNISRKFAIPLLEYFDRQRVTRRDGDARIVL